MAHPTPAAEPAEALGKPTPPSPAADHGPSEQRRREIERGVYERRSLPDKPAEEELERRRAEHSESRPPADEAAGGGAKSG